MMHDLTWAVSVIRENSSLCSWCGRVKLTIDGSNFNHILRSWSRFELSEAMPPDCQIIFWHTPDQDPKRKPELMSCAVTALGRAAGKIAKIVQKNETEQQNPLQLLNQRWRKQLCKNYTCIGSLRVSLSAILLIQTNFSKNASFFNLLLYVKLVLKCDPY